MNEQSFSRFLQHAFDKDDYNLKYYEDHKAEKKWYNYHYYRNNKDKWHLKGGTTTTTTKPLPSSASKRDTTTTTTTAEATPEKRKKYLPERVLDKIIQFTPGLSVLYEDTEDFVRSVSKLFDDIDNLKSKARDRINAGKEFTENGSFDFSKIRAKIDDYEQKFTRAKNKYDEVAGKVRGFFGF